jgi:hypothetical protein
MTIGGPRPKASLAVPMPGIVYQDVEPIRRRLDRTEDLVRPRRALMRLLQLEEQPAAAL